MSRPLRGPLAAVVVLALASSGPVRAAVPVLVESAAGRFEISAVDSSPAHAVAAMAEEGWRLLTAPLALPDAFTSPVYLRILPAADMAGETPFHVTVEPGGLVSARLRADAATPWLVRRALVQALLVRLAVARHGVTEHLSAPLWLEHAGVVWWETRASPSKFDAIRQVAATEGPVAVEALLAWKRGEIEPPAYSRSAYWLLAFLQSESGGEGEWAACLVRLLRGDDPLIALTSSYPGRYHSAAERALWWQTGYHHLRRIRALPALEAAESREQLGALARFVFAGADGATDFVVPIRQLVARAGEPVVAAELARRAGQLPALIARLHPFYRNAGLSLGEALAPGQLPATRRDAALAAFEQDWRDAFELEKAARTALDRLENEERARAR